MKFKITTVLFMATLIFGINGKTFSNEIPSNFKLPQICKYQFPNKSFYKWWIKNILCYKCIWL